MRTYISDAGVAPFANRCHAESLNATNFGFSWQRSIESFLDYLLMVLPALRVDLFQEHAKPVGATITAAAASGDSELVFVLVNKKHGLTARARLDGDYLTVLEGSSARQHWEGKGTWDTSYARLHAELRKTGVLVDESGLCRFAMGYAFASPSAAAAVVNGRPSNGTVDWKVESTGQTYKDWEAGQLEIGETHMSKLNHPPEPAVA